MGHLIKYHQSNATDAGAKQMIKVLLEHPIVVNTSDTGAGKTFMSIRTIGVVDPTAHILVFTTKKQVDSKNWEDSIDSYNQEVHKANLTYTVINYEQLREKKRQKELIKKLKKHLNQSLYMIVDESQKIKNPTSKNFKHVIAITKMPNFKRTICLTATPASESLLNLCSYLILAGYYKNKTDFNRQHVIRYDKYFQPIIKDYSGTIHNEWLVNYRQIIAQFDSIQVFIDTTKLRPPTLYKEIKFHFDKDTQKAYRQIKKDYINGVYESIASANAAQRNFIAEHDEHRKKVLSKIIDDPTRPTGPVLIFYQYNSERDSLLKYFSNHHQDYKIFQINGDHKYDVRNTPPEKSLFLCQYQAASEGLNASWSHCSVFYTPTYSWEKFKQAMGRNTRAYQQGTTYHFRFVVMKTINQHYWYDLIDNKQNFTTELMEQYLTNDD